MLTIIDIKEEKSLFLNKLVHRFELCNRIEGKSYRTIDWYTNMLGQFLEYLKTQQLSLNTSRFSKHRKGGETEITTYYIN